MSNYNKEAEETGRSTIAANTIDGVYVSEIPSDAKYVFYDDDFFNELKTVEDGYTIFGIVDDETLSEINEKYGIR